jgi:hypothetical protein
MRYTSATGLLGVNSPRLACHDPGGKGAGAWWNRLSAPGGAVLLSLACSPLAVAQAPAPGLPAGAVTPAGAQAGAGALDCGDRKQLFLDGSLFAEARNITLRMNPPAKAGVAVRAERPWEKEIGFCVSVLEHDGLCRMWYLAQGGKGGTQFCYAVSKDGIAWEKPHLGLFEVDGSKDNNIVMQGNLETMVFLDPVAPPERRFKALAQCHWPDAQQGGLYVHTSPDGIHWQLSEQRVLPLGADSANQVFYDGRLRKYVAYLRTWVPRDAEPGGEGLGRRRIGRLEMDDVTQPWPFTPSATPYCIWGEGKIPVASTEIPTVFSYDAGDPANSDHYHPAAVQYPWADRAYFLFPSAYLHATGLLDTQMATSRDGIAWTRVSREPYVSLGTEEDFDCGSLYMAAGMVRRQGRIFQYYGGYRVTHLWGSVDPKPDEPAAHIFRLEQRLDGFVSADADAQGGEFTTPPLVFSGSRLELNANASALGLCRVEILDQSGRAMPGYALDECDAVSGNHLAQTVSWKGKADLSAVRGHAVRLRFVMRSCKLFAFQFPS